MPRAPKSEAEKALEQQVKDLIRNIKGSDKPQVDVARAITLFEAAQRNIAKALAVLKGEEIEEAEPAKKTKKSASKTSASVLDETGPIDATEAAAWAKDKADGDSGTNPVVGDAGAPQRQSGNPNQRRRANG